MNYGLQKWIDENYPDTAAEDIPIEKIWIAAIGIGYSRGIEVGYEECWT